MSGCRHPRHLRRVVLLQGTYGPPCPYRGYCEGQHLVVACERCGARGVSCSRRATLWTAVDVPDVPEEESYTSVSRCDRCGDTVRDIDAGFSPGLHAMGCPCGGTFRVVPERVVETEPVAVFACGPDDVDESAGLAEPA